MNESLGGLWLSGMYIKDRLNGLAFCYGDVP